MKFDENLAAIHGYLCGDGYVIKNPETQKHKYYYIGFRNTDDILLKDFQKKFNQLFKIKPIITNEGRCKTQNKDIYYFLTKEFSYYSYEWTLPKLSKPNLRFWLRAFFDCEGWVENQVAKSRLIGLDCCNQNGMSQVKDALKRFNIQSSLKKKTGRIIWRLTICGKENLILFSKLIGFLHPNKNTKLFEAINSYQNLCWEIPKNKKDIFEFVIKKGKLRRDRDEVQLTSVNQLNVVKLQKALNKYNIKSKLFGPYGKSSRYYCLTIKQEVFQNEGNKKWTSTRDEKNLR
jgi:hypothetical protein